MDVDSLLFSYLTPSSSLSTTDGRLARHKPGQYRPGTPASGGGAAGERQGLDSLHPFAVTQVPAAHDGGTAGAVGLAVRMAWGNHQW
jgi:hypothetical protein